MKLLDNFFRIVEQDGMTIKVAMNADHEIYKAHFPGNPITPGVCLVQMATEMYQEICHEPLILAEISKIKYRNVVKPSDLPSYFFTPMGEDEENRKVKVEIKDGEKVFTEMTLCYKRGVENI